MKVELLSPAGNFEALKAAVHNGCDAVYFAGKNYGARKFAENFSLEEIKEAIDYAHLYNVKVYITVNTLMFNQEIDACLDYIEHLHRYNVDALIMQDIGLMNIVHHKYPKLAIHASTQCHNHNNEGINLLKDFGVSRVVLDREMPIEEIKQLDTDLQLEIFIHGALCVSYSGNCLMSYLNGGRSGNRGQCAQCCRLPYQLVKDGKVIETNGDYLLSPRELNTSSQIASLIQANITSFKIEGRMKSSEYVGFITKYYRDIIDNYYLGIISNIDREFELYSLFNRQFTLGYLFNTPFNQLMNITTSNHQGVKIGQVINFNSKYIDIQTDYDLYQNDGIRIGQNGFIINKLFDTNNFLVNKIEKGKIARIENKINLHHKDEVRRTIDSKLMDSLKNYPLKHIPISIYVEAFVDQPLNITFKDNCFTVTKLASLVQRSKTSPTTKQNIENQLTKLGNTPFVCDNITINSDESIFISLKELNEIKRELTERLINLKKRTKPIIINDKEMATVTANKTHTISCLVHNLNQAKVVSEMNCEIITDNLQVAKEYNCFYKLPRVMMKHPKFTNKKLLINEFGGLCYCDNNEVYVDYPINTANDYTLNYLFSKGVKKVTISDEAITNGSSFSNNYNLEAVIYGRLEAMTTKYCPLNYLLNNSKKPCDRCNQQYYLKQQDKLYPLVSRNCITTILNYQPVNYLDSISDLKQRGITNFRLDFFNEDEQTIREILKKLQIEL